MKSSKYKANTDFVIRRLEDALSVWDEIKMEFPVTLYFTFLKHNDFRTQFFFWASFL